MNATDKKKWIVPTTVLLAVLVLAGIYRQQLVSWFGGAPESASSAVAGAAAPSAEHDHAAMAALPAASTGYHFEEAARLRLREAFAAYEAIRAQLAHDTIDGIADYARAIEQAVSEAGKGAVGAPPEVAKPLAQAAEEAKALAAAQDLKAARHPFGELSRQLVTLIERDPDLAQGMFLFKCTMAEGFQKWVQPSDEIENPYMGQSMSQCGEKLDWAPEGAGSAQPAAEAMPAAGGDIAYYTCPMHPSVKQSGPGNCPICGMTLTPVTKSEVETGTIVVDEGRRQRIGVKIGAATKQNIKLQIKSVGEVKYDETRLSDVNLRMSGWVQRLQVNQMGQRVARGQTLFTLYSPELYAAQLEHLAAFKREGEAGGTSLLAGFAQSSRQRLRLLGMTEGQISELEKRGEAQEHVPIPAPSSGVVIEKNVVEGARVDAGMLVYRIADLSRVWIDAEVFEADLPHVSVGQPATIELPYLPGQSYEGKVDFIYPELQAKTRTGRVRVVLKNQDLTLKPDMYANVTLEVDLGERLAVPESAIVYTGPRRLVFVDLGEGKLRPQEVKLGVHSDGLYEVAEGLAEGDQVVVSGNFLIAAESRIRSAAQYWEDTDDAK